MGGGEWERPGQWLQERICWPFCPAWNTVQPSGCEPRRGPAEKGRELRPKRRCGGKERFPYRPRDSLRAAPRGQDPPAALGGDLNILLCLSRPRSVGLRDNGRGPSGEASPHNSAPHLATFRARPPPEAAEERGRPLGSPASAHRRPSVPAHPGKGFEQ